MEGAARPSGGRAGTATGPTSARSTCSAANAVAAVHDPGRRSARREPFSFAVFGDWGQVDATGQQPGPGEPDAPDRRERRPVRRHRPATTATRRAARATTATSSRSAPTRARSSARPSGPCRRLARRSSRPSGNHGLARSDAVHPHFANWPQDLAVSDLGRAVPDRHVLLPERQRVGELPERRGTPSTPAAHASTCSTRRGPT